MCVCEILTRFGALISRTEKTPLPSPHPFFVPGPHRAEGPGDAFAGVLRAPDKPTSRPSAGGRTREGEHPAEELSRTPELPAAA